MTITQTVSNRYNIYKFTSRGTEYEVPTEPDRISVYSNRYGGPLGKRIAVYESLEEMAQRSKVLKQLAELIKASNQPEIMQ